MTGTDTAGKITVTTGTGCSVGGILTTLNFSSAFAAAPKVTLTPAGPNAAALGSYVDDATIGTGSFQVGSVSAPTDATTYRWYYHVLQ